MADIRRINENTWAIEDGMVRFFVLEGENKALLIDSGMTTSGDQALTLSKTIVSENKPIELLNTHTDMDHIAGNDAFDFCYIHVDEEKKYRSSGKNNPVITLVDGDVIDLGNRPLRIIHIPGHTPGSIAILDINSRVLFSGDTVSDATIYMFGEYRNLETYINSLTYLKSLTDDFDRIYPSHGTPELDNSQIEYLLEYAINISLGKVAGSVIDLWGNKIMLHKFEKGGFFCDLPVNKAVTTEVMRKSDAWTIENLVDSKELMSRAGHSIVEAMTENNLLNGPVAIVCGKGNNAGDGFVVASILKDMGYELDVFLLYPDCFSADGKHFFEECIDKNVGFFFFDESHKFEDYNTIVDCIFGTGFRGEPTDIALAAINNINEAGVNGAKVICADINSGINGDTGEGVTYVKSDLTVSIGSYKIGHFKGDSLTATKSIINKDIGIVIGEY